MSKTPKYKIPFAKSTGEMMSYSDTLAGEDHPYVEWRDIFEFEASLAYAGYAGAGSAMTMTVQSDDGALYPMFWCYFERCIRRPNNSQGPTFHGKWTFVKHGANYSVCPVEEIP